MKRCNQSTITDEAYRLLANLRSLDVRNFSQSTITDEPRLQQRREFQQFELSNFKIKLNVLYNSSLPSLTVE